MQHLCKSCNHLLEEGDIVTVKVTSMYHILKSSISYALDRNFLEAEAKTLAHQNCQVPKGQPEGD